MSIGSDAIASGALGASSSASYSIQVASATFTLSMQGAGKNYRRISIRTIYIRW